MAGKIRNRRELRRESDAAEAFQAETPAQVPGELAEGEVPVVKPGRKASLKPKAPAKPRVKKPRATKAIPRQRARWGIFDASMKQVAIFDYNQRPEADEKLASIIAKGKNGHFIQMIKETFTEPAVIDVPLNN